MLKIGNLLIVNPTLRVRVVCFLFFFPYLTRLKHLNDAIKKEFTKFELLKFKKKVYNVFFVVVFFFGNSTC